MVGLLLIDLPLLSQIYMYRVYELDNYISSFEDRYTNFSINTFTNGFNFRVGSVDQYGLELSISKGDYTLDNVFYSTPYPGATIYNSISTTRTFAYKLNYKFNPLIYYANGLLYYHNTDNNNSFDTTLFSNGFLYKHNNIDYIVDGFKINVLNYTTGNGDSGSFVINSSGGSYYNDPTESNYLNVNYNLDNYSNSYYSFSDIISPFITYNVANSSVKENTYSTGNFNNSLAAYFRDFKRDNYDIYVGFYNNPLIVKKSVASDLSFDGLQRKDLYDIPNLSSFLANTNDFNNQPLLMVQQDNNFKLSNSFYYIGSSDLSFFTKYIGKNDIRNIIDDYGFDGSFNDLIESNWIIDYLGNVDDITSSTTPKTSYGYSGYDFIEYSLTINRDNKKFDSLDYSELTFSNSIYFDSTSNINVRLSGFNLDGLPVISFNDNTFLSAVFNSTMGIGFGAITIGGLATAVFLFRGLISLFRSNK